MKKKKESDIHTSQASLYQYLRRITSLILKLRVID